MEATIAGVYNAARCGTCHFGKLTPELAAKDLTKRVCIGVPPTPQYMIINNRPSMQMVRPVVSVTDDTCALYKDKSENDIARDREAATLAVDDRMMKQ